MASSEQERAQDGTAPLGVQWHMTRVPADDFGCFDGQEHWDVWYWHSEVETIRSEPGIFEGKLLPPSEANVCCILGDEATVRHLVDLHNASSAPSPRGLSNVRQQRTDADRGEPVREVRPPEVGARWPRRMPLHRRESAALARDAGLGVSVYGVRPRQTLF